MIPNAEKTMDVQSNIETTGTFTVDESALGHIMDVLTNLYSDPEGAVVREYLTNAFDAQVEAGQVVGKNWKPIKVTTPSHFNKAYVIRDYGVGMSTNDLTDTYSKYGKSTKTTSNDVVGMLGLGSKCALTYTNSFTITGFKAGVKTVAIISKNEENIPVFSVVDTCKTDEPDGVEISIPVKDRNSFQAKTASFLKWWTPGLVEVDGKAPTPHGYTLVNKVPVEWVNSGKKMQGFADVYLVEGGDRWNPAKSHVVMGNVAYEVDFEYVPNNLSGNGLGYVAYVPMSSVNFPPSREKLMYTANTKGVLAAVGNGLFDHIVEQKVREFANIKTFKEAWLFRNNLPHSFKSHAKIRDLKFKGHDFPEREQHPHLRLTWDYNGRGVTGLFDWYQMDRMMQGGLIVTGVDPKSKPTSYFKKKVIHYMDENGITNEIAYLVDTDIDSVWVDWMPRIDADTIKAIKLPKTPAQNLPRVEVGYDWVSFGDNGQWSRGTDLIVPNAKKKTLTYISPQDMRETYRKRGISSDALAKHLGSDYILVVMGKNRFEKFLRTHKGAIPIATAWQDRINALVAAATDAEFISGTLEYGEREFLSKVDETKIDDPELVSLIQSVKNGSKTTNYAKAELMHTVSRNAEIRCTLPAKKVVKVNVTKRYPLINHVGGRQFSHMITYINAVYQQEYAPAKP